MTRTHSMNFIITKRLTAALDITAVRAQDVEYNPPTNTSKHFLYDSPR